MKIPAQLLSFVLVAAALLASQSAVAQCTLPCTLIWEDEFNGSTLDTSKWEHQRGNGSLYGNADWGNSEQQYYRPENTSVGGGLLTITAKQESFGGKNYTSSRIRSIKQGDWAYGRFEARIKLPQNQGTGSGGGEGTWPAFWMLSTHSLYGAWPNAGEIDIMEWKGGNPGTLYGTLHYPAGTSNFSQNDGTTTSLGAPLAFHTYAVEWEPGVMRWYLDGNLYFTRSNWSSGILPYTAPFNTPFHFLINMAVGGNFVGNPANGTWPQELVVDYVRVYDMGDTIQQEPTDPLVFADFEHNDVPDAWFKFDGSNGGGGVSSTSDNPPGDGGNYAMQSTWGGSSGYFGAFGLARTMDLTSLNTFSFWINPYGAGQDYTLEFNIQDDDTNDGIWINTADDEFQFKCRVSATGPCAIAGGGWQKVTVSIDEFVHDTTFATGGNGVLDTEPGGNGRAVNMTVAVIDTAGGSSGVEFRTDYWLFECIECAGEPVQIPFPLPALGLLGGLLASIALLRQTGSPRRRQLGKH